MRCRIAATRPPRRQDCREILAYIRSLETERHHRHRSHRAEAAAPSDLCDYTWSRRPIWLPVSAVWTSWQQPHSPSLVRRYARRIDRGEPIPPVVLVDRKAWYEILDGAHRVEAAHLRGLKRIPVFVGRRLRRSP